MYRKFNGGPVFPFFDADHIYVFMQQYIHRGKLRTSILHAHNTSATADMVVNMRTALNQVANWERNDMVWTFLVNAVFPLTTFQFPFGHFPLSNKYSPASGERMDSLCVCVCVCVCITCIIYVYTHVYIHVYMYVYMY